MTQKMENISGPPYLPDVKDDVAAVVRQRALEQVAFRVVVVPKLRRKKLGSS